MQFASWKERKAIAATLKPIYGAESATAVAARLDEFDAGPWGTRVDRLQVACREQC